MTGVMPRTGSYPEGDTQMRTKIQGTREKEKNQIKHLKNTKGSIGLKKVPRKILMYIYQRHIKAN